MKQGDPGKHSSSEGPRRPSAGPAAVRERRLRPAGEPVAQPAAFRPSLTRRWNRGLRRLRSGWQGLLGRDAVWIILFVGVATWALTPTRQWAQARGVEVGIVADHDYVASHDALFLDREATAEKQRRAREEVLPVYDLDPAAAGRAFQELDRLFAIGREAEELPLAQLPLRLQAAGLEMRVDAGQLAVLARHDYSPELLERLRSVVGQVLERGVVAGKAVLIEHRERGILLRDLATGRERRQIDLFDYLDYPDEVRRVLGVEVRSWSDYSSADRAALVDLLLGNLTPNLHLNQSETLRRQEEASSAVEQVFNRVRRGQVIVRKGDPIRERDAAVLAELAGSQATVSRLLPILGKMLLLASIALLLWLGVRRERMVLTKRRTVLGEALLLLLCTVIATKLCYLVATGLGTAIDADPFNDARAYYYAIPFAALALVAVLLYGRSLALLMALSFSLLAGLILEDASWGWVLYSMAGSLAAILTVDHYQFKQRSVMMRAGAVVSVVSLGTVLMLTATSGAEVQSSTLAFELLCALGSGMLVAAAASFFIPVLESAFSLTTGIKLLELANTNLPLLRRLAFEAPGTFQHSLMVANLSKAGCEAINADAVLAYTGALYHDIGKVYRPDYFVENQRPGQNKHDKLLPSMSSLILTNHVKEGLELAREHHLPEPIQDAIAQHHGTRLITYFFNKAIELHDPQSGDLTAEMFRYPGPRPQSKVMGVLMLADGVEAACRSLSDPSPASLRTVIKAITDDCLRDGQLDETDLTLGDLGRIAEAFLRVLTHIHHRRLDYPGFDFKGRRKPEGRGGRGPASGDAASPDSGEIDVPGDGARGATA